MVFRQTNGVSTDQWYLGPPDTKVYHGALKMLQKEVDNANVASRPGNPYRHAVKKVHYATGKVGLYWREIFIPLNNKK